MRGEIEFQESLLQRVALLAGLKETELQRVYDQRLKLSPGAEVMLERLKALGIRIHWCWKGCYHLVFIFFCRIDPGLVFTKMVFMYRGDVCTSQHCLHA